MRVGSVIKASAIVHGISAAEIVGPRRDRYIVAARQVAMYVARRDTRASLPEIARRMGGRDHTTVLHGYRKMAAAIAHDVDVVRKIDQVADLARSLNARRGVETSWMRTAIASEISVSPPSIAIQPDLMPEATPEPKIIETPASDPFTPVADPTAALAKLSLSRYPVGSRVWCEIQHARFFQHMGMPYTPSVRVLKSGGVVHGV